MASYYVTPNSTIQLMRNCPLDPEHENTIYFPDINAQTGYFSMLAASNGISFNEQSYQRYSNGVLRINAYAEDINDCNYMRFRNVRNNRAKWYYAFVIRVEYINEHVSEVEYVIDSLQTWLFDFTLDMCFVEREHVYDDTLYLHRKEEPISPQQCAVNGRSINHFLDQRGIGTDETCVVMVTTKMPKNENPTKADDWISGANTASGEGHLFSGLFYRTFVLSSANGRDEWWTKLFDDDNALLSPKVNDAGLDEYFNLFINNGQSEAIVDIFQMPTFVPTGGQRYATRSWRYARNIADDFEGYHPRNSKLYCYPYSRLLVTNNQGNEIEFRYELFDNPGLIEFHVFGTCIGAPQIVLTPLNYQHIQENMSLSLTMVDFVHCAYVNNIWEDWIASNRNQVHAQVIASGISTIADIGAFAFSGGFNTPTPASVKTGGWSSSARGVQIMKGAEQVVDTGSKIAQTFASKYDMLNTPGKVSGLTSCSPFQIIRNQYMFTAHQMSCTAEVARCIDNYFTMYGYSCGEVKIPSLHNRERWTYVKTVGCNLHGSLPAEAMSEICGIFDNGIRWWVSGSDIGNYNLSNSPLGGGGGGDIPENVTTIGNMPLNLSYNFPDKSSANWFILHGPLSAGTIKIKARQPRTKNLIKWPYQGLIVCPKDAPTWGSNDGAFYAGWDFSVLTDPSADPFNATINTNNGQVHFPTYATNANNPYKFNFILNGTVKILPNGLQYYDPDVDTLYPPGTYTYSYTPNPVAWTQMQTEVRATNEQGLEVLSPSDYWGAQEGIKGRLTITINEPCYITITIYSPGLYYGRNGIKEITMSPQLELSDSATEYEGLGEAKVTSFTLDSDLPEGGTVDSNSGYVYPAGLPIEVPAMELYQGDNIIMIDDPETKNVIEINTYVEEE